MFQQFDKLCVLKLSACQFCFTSPPFLCCHNLRFLWLDRCKEGSSRTAEVVKLEDIRRFFQRLWVLDVRHSNKALLFSEMTDPMTQLMELNVAGERPLDMDLVRHRRLHNIRKLRVRKSRFYSSTRQGQILFSGMDKMELLEFSRNEAFYLKASFSVESSCRSLETVIIDGCTYLEGISLMGCAKLKNIYLSGSIPDLYSIDITGAAVKTLDLSAVTAPNLDKLFLLECRKLCAILWPPAAEGRRKRYLGELRIDTIQQEGTTAAGDNTAGREFDWHISVGDERILGSLEPVKDYFGPNSAHVYISTPHNPSPDVAASCKDDGIMTSSSGHQVMVPRNLKLLEGNAVYADVPVSINNESYCDAPPPNVSAQGCYMHIEDQWTLNLQGFICDGAKTLHIHDSLHITGILAAPSPASATWNQLEWCRVERCPKLGYVFSLESDMEMFKKLRTTWVSCLPNARYIWRWGDQVSPLQNSTFADLTLLHLDRWPRLMCIMHFPTASKDFTSLETLEIMWCGDISVAFDTFNSSGRMFPKLKHIHLHELPKLQGIHGIGHWVWAPELEIVKIRGCWSLRTLPIVDSKNVVECDYEKEWWDRLEWESAEHANKYKPMHPRYYKKAMLKGSVLR